jgi:4-alpha-glucanotransferase
LQGLTDVRRSGLLIPLFSSASSESWGIGEIADVAFTARWLAGAGQRVLQLLPLNEMAGGQHSPYSAASALAIDPIFIRLAHVPEFAALGGEAALDDKAREALGRVRALPHVDYDAVRRLKRAALERAFARFCDREWARGSDRAVALRRFIEAEKSWLSDYALFRALQDRAGGRAWTEWPGPLKERDAQALAAAHVELAHEILFYEYVQWIADSQWQDARRAAREHGVQLFGDLPFMVDTNSADVWLHQERFRLDVSVGVPPDAFSTTGQNWGMPLYCWDKMAADGFPWLRQRAARSAKLFDGYRVDHLVGFYRTYGRPLDGGPAFFTPSEEPAQVALGERVLGIMRESGAEIIAEDLGVVPDFVRASLARVGVPGFRVHRWERFWSADGQPFRDPREYPALSVATTGTHDTEPLAVWWDNAAPAERIAAAPSIGDRPFDADVRDRLIEALFGSGSDLVLFPVQDVFGWRERINEPATVNDTNWTYRLPWSIDRFDDEPEARACQTRLREWAAAHGRARQAEGPP